MLPPHFHPRASNYVVAIHGNTTTYMYAENGARLVTQHLTPGRATIFPQASMHMMMNTGACDSVSPGWCSTNAQPGCENAQLISALNSDDPGTLNVGQVFANGFPAELVNAAFGQDLANEDVERKMTPVGTGSNWGPESCLRRCGIVKPETGNGTSY
jgi:hypothetical protein